MCKNFKNQYLKNGHTDVLVLIRDLKSYPLNTDRWTDGPKIILIKKNKAHWDHKSSDISNHLK